MDKYIRIAVSLALIFCVTSSFGAWRKGCLNECFATGHDCDYCAYQCEKSDYRRLVPNYDGDTMCPFSSTYDPYDDN